MDRFDQPTVDSSAGEPLDLTKTIKVCLLILALRLTFRPTRNSPESQEPQRPGRDDPLTQTYMQPKNSENTVISSAINNGLEEYHDEIASNASCRPKGNDYSGHPKAGSHDIETHDRFSLLRTVNSENGLRRTTPEQTPTVPRPRASPIASAGHQIENISLSDYANAHIGDSYNSYSHVTNNSSTVHTSHDSLRVGVLAGTTAAMMTQILSLVPSLLSKVVYQEHSAYSATFEEHVAHDIADVVGKSWITDYRAVGSMQTTNPLRYSQHEVPMHDSEVVFTSLRGLVPIVRASQSCVLSKPSSWKDPSSETIHELLNLMGIRKQVDLSSGDVSDCSMQRYHNDVLGSERCVAVMDVPSSSECCPIISQYGFSPTVSALVLPNDYFAQPVTSVRTAMVVFKSKESAAEALSDWMRYPDAQFPISDWESRGDQYAPVDLLGPCCSMLQYRMIKPKEVPTKQGMVYFLHLMKTNPLMLPPRKLKKFPSSKLPSNPEIVVVKMNPFEENPIPWFFDSK